MGGIPGRVKKSGSASFLLLSSIADFLAGRKIYFAVCRFTAQEKIEYLELAEKGRHEVDFIIDGEQ